MKIGITNLKGGVGKTTLSINLAVAFAHMEYKVCIVDTDTNQNSLAWYGVRDEELPDIMVVGATDPNALGKAVKALHNEYDVVIMDGTPNLSEMNTRVIMSSDILLIPTRPGAHDFRAMKEFMMRLDQVREIREVAAYFVVNEFDQRISLHKEVKKSLEDYEIPVLEQTLKSRTAFGESNYSGTGVLESNDDKAKQEIIALTKKIIDIATLHNFITN